MDASWIVPLGVNLVVLAIAATWGISTIKDTIKKEVRQELDFVRNKVENELDGMNRVFSESIMAVREKANQVELAAYKDFVRRDSFHEIMNRVSAEIGAYKDAIEARLDRQEAKLDRLIAK